MKFLITVAALAGALLTAPSLIAANAGPFEEPTVRSAGEIRIAGKRMEYSAETGRIAIRDPETGDPRGQMFYIAYRVPADSPRPLAFIWNGGPGANSSLLHFWAAGPKILPPNSASPVAFATNPDTWLTAMDLVFVDPIGTGFSRPTKPEYAEEFYGTVGDVASVSEFVRAWRIVHAAEEAPLILVGESWGAGRAGSVGYQLEQRGIPVHALVLISGGTGIHDNPVPGPLRTALRVVDLSTTAFHHGRLDPSLGNSAAEVRQQAEVWARQTYAPALERLESLSGAEKDAIAEGFSRYTGVPAAAVDRATLQVPPRPYREALLSDVGKQLQIFDMRLLVDDSPSAGDEGRAERDAILSYLRQDLGYRTSLLYMGLQRQEVAYAPSGQYPAPVGGRWNYATAELSPEEIQAAYEDAMRKGDGPPRMGPPLPSAAEAVGLDPSIHVLVATGRFDSLNSCTADQELAAELTGALAEAYAFACYDGGHMMYLDVQARTRLAHDVRALADTAP